VKLLCQKKLIYQKIIKHQRGFTYASALMLSVLVGLSASVATKVTSTLAQRVNESELLFRGQAYKQAIESFYLAKSPHRYPKGIEQLLKDPRFINKKHLRKKYADPMDRSSRGWTKIFNESGDIMGVASSSTQTPLQSENFPLGLEVFSESKTYQDWKFVYLYLPKSKVSSI